MKVFKASPRDRVQQRFVVQTTSFLHLFTLVEVLRGGLQGSSPGTRFNSRLWSRRRQFLQLLKVVVEVLGEVFQAFSQGQSSTASAVEQTLSQAPLRSVPRASAAVPSPSVPASVSSWTRAAYEDQDSADEPATQHDEDEELLLEEEDDPSGWRLSIAASGRPFYWHRSSRRSVWHLPPGASSRRRKRR